MKRPTRFCSRCSSCSCCGWEWFGGCMEKAAILVSSKSSELFAETFVALQAFKHFPLALNVWCYPKINDLLFMPWKRGQPQTDFEVFSACSSWSETFLPKQRCTQNRFRSILGGKTQHQQDAKCDLQGIILGLCVLLLLLSYLLQWLFCHAQDHIKLQLKHPSSDSAIEAMQLRAPQPWRQTKPLSTECASAVLALTVAMGSPTLLGNSTNLWNVHYNL